MFETRNPYTFLLEVPWADYVEKPSEDLNGFFGITQTLTECTTKPVALSLVEAHSDYFVLKNGDINCYLSESGQTVIRRSNLSTKS